MAQTPLQPLSVGNVVSAAFRLYRDRLSTYLGIAVRASLWALLPLLVILPIPFLFLFDTVGLSILWIGIPVGSILLIFGWAKYTTNLALISRLAFGFLANKPETVREASSHVIPKMWRFWQASFLTFLIVFGVCIGFGLVVLICVWVGSLIFSISQNIVLVLSLLGLLGIVALVVAIVALIRLMLRFSLIEVPLAIENQLSASQTISRSWKLTQGYIAKIWWIFIVATLITLPIQLAAYFLASLIEGIITEIVVVDTNSPILQAILFLVSWITGLIFGVFLVPFWQTIKATIYYDIRSRKEGLDIQLGN